MSNDDFLFNHGEITDLIAEAGHQLLFLQRSVAIPRDTDVGSPADYSWTKTPITAYVIPEARRLMFLTPGATPLGDGGYIAYIQPSKLFGLDLLSSETFVEWEGRNYAIEQRESIFHRGRIYLYKFKLKRTQDQQMVMASRPQAIPAEIVLEPVPAPAQWVDLRGAVAIAATTRPQVNLVKSEKGFEIQGVQDWSAWVCLNQPYDLWTTASVVVVVKGTSLVGLVPSDAEFDDFPQNSFMAGVHFKKSGQQVAIASILQADKNFYALGTAVPVVGEYQCLRFFAAGAELMVEAGEFVDGALGEIYLITSLGPLPEGTQARLAFIAPHGSITIAAHS